MVLEYLDENQAWCDKSPLKKIMGSSPLCFCCCFASVLACMKVVPCRYNECVVLEYWLELASVDDAVQHLPGCSTPLPPQEVCMGRSRTQEAGERGSGRRMECKGAIGNWNGVPGQLYLRCDEFHFFVPQKIHCHQNFQYNGKGNSSWSEKVAEVGGHSALTSLGSIKQYLYVTSVVLSKSFSSRLQLAA